MVLFFKDKNELIYAVDSPKDLDSKSISKLEWLFVGKYIDNNQISSKKFLGPKKTMITPWSTNAVEIAQNMAINGLLRIEVFKPFCESLKSFDPMLFELYDGLNQDIFKNNILPNPLKPPTALTPISATIPFKICPKRSFVKVPCAFNSVIPFNC